jgi:histidinol-phosphate aminotransferase
VSVYWNSRVKNLSPYVPGEQPQGKKLIKLNTNENPYPPSPLVIEALKKAAGDNLRLYPDPACTELREAIAARYRVKPEQVFTGNGSDEALAFAFGAFFESGPDALPALFPDISYSFYPVYSSLWGIPYKTIPVAEDFSVNADNYKITCGGVILANPNAPTGIALSVDRIKQIACFLEKNKKVLIVDEAYIDFADPGEALSIIPFCDENMNVLAVHTLSKSASLAGLRVGFAIGSAALVEGLCRIRDSFNSYTMDRLALAGAAAAILDDGYYNTVNKKIIATRLRVSSSLAALGFKVIPSQANFIFASPPVSSGIGGQALYAALREKGILVRHFNKPRIAEYLRITVGRDDDMDVFLQTCGEIINR